MLASGPVHSGPAAASCSGGARLSPVALKLRPLSCSQVNYLPTKLYNAQDVLVELAQRCMGGRDRAGSLAAGCVPPRLPPLLLCAGSAAHHLCTPCLPCVAAGSERVKEEQALRGGLYSYAFLVACQLWAPPLLTQIAGAPQGCRQGRRQGTGSGPRSSAQAQ